MSDTPCLDSTDNILGQEFLTWLWYQSDVAPGAFVDKEGQPFSVSMEQRIVVQGGEGDAKETATVAGTLSPLREARFGLGTGKKVTRALIRLEKEELAFQFTLNPFLQIEQAEPVHFAVEGRMSRRTLFHKLGKHADFISFLPFLRNMAEDAFALRTAFPVRDYFAFVGIDIFLADRIPL